jgi:hypothetical protein
VPTSSRLPPPIATWLTHFPLSPFAMAAFIRIGVVTLLGVWVSGGLSGPTTPPRGPSTNKALLLASVGRWPGLM